MCLQDSISLGCLRGISIPIQNEHGRLCVEEQGWFRILLHTERVNGAIANRHAISTYKHKLDSGFGFERHTPVDIVLHT